MHYCDMTADCLGETHSAGCWRGWLNSHRPAPAAAGFFTIQAEFLHQFIGRRAALISDRGNKIPFTIGAVTYRPERHQIEVDAQLPHQVVGFAFGAADIVEVQHAA